MKKEYVAPEICIEEFELENTTGGLCNSSGISQIPFAYFNDGQIE